MSPITAEQTAAMNQYRQRIISLGTPAKGRSITPWPGLVSLMEFVTVLNKPNDCTESPKISLVNIPAERETNEASNPAPKVSIEHVEGVHGLLEKIPSSTDSTPTSTMIIVENICANSLVLLGGVYDIDPQFFAEHVNILPWYKHDENMSERLTSLPSTKKAEDFLSLRYVEARELSPSDCSSIYASSIMWPDSRGTRLSHSAGKLIPCPREGQAFPPTVFTRQTVSVWCQKKTNGNGWIAIMLLNPPFQPKPEYGFVGEAEYRSPNLRPKMKEGLPEDGHKESFRRAFCHLLEQRCSGDNMYLSTCATDVFLVLYEGYRVISSEWLLVNEYIKRELANIELRLEKAEASFHELKVHLRELYRIRRGCNKYCEIVKEAASQCKSRGQALWPSSSSKVTSPSPSPSPPPNGHGDAIAFVKNHAQDLEDDFQYVLDNMATSIYRIEKNITLLMTLVAIGDSRQGLRQNRSVAMLALVATMFLPSQTVASVLGLQTRYGPGADNFWVLWVVALPLTFLVVGLPFLYPIGSAALNKTWASIWGQPGAGRRRRRAGQRASVDLCNDLELQLHATPMNAVGL